MAAIFRDHQRSEAERSIATTILADYASDDAELIASLLLDAEPPAFVALFPKAQAVAYLALTVLESELARKAPPEAKEDDKDKLAEPGESSGGTGTSGSR